MCYIILKKMEERVKSIEKVLKEILNMPYYRNYQATSGKVHNTANHENAVEDILVANGYDKSRIEKVSKKERDQLLGGDDSVLATMENNTYISQPCGTHNSPDFIIKDERGRLFFKECKSVKGGTPMYNSGIPTPRYIYILSSEKHNATTLFMGEDCLPPKAKALIENHIRKQRLEDQRLNNVLQSMTNHGISYYTRPMIQHKGSKTKTNYFLNDSRLLNEQNVFAHIR
jgi:hypothetical protein